MRPPTDQLTLHVAERGTLREALDWYLNRCTAGCSLAYVQKRRAETEWLCGWFGGGMWLSELGYERLCNFRDRGRERGLAPTTVSTRLDLLKAALAEAVRREIIPRLPPWPVVRDARPRRAKRAPTVAEYERVRPFVPVERRPWYDVAFWCGLRKSDVAATRRYHLDMVNGEWVRRSTKTHAPPEVLPMPPRLRELLAMEFDLRPRAETDRVCGVWPNASRDLGRACARAGVPRFTATDLRRGCRARLVLEGHSTTEIESWMCHSEAVARRHYDAVNADTRAAMRGRMR